MSTTSFDLDQLLKQRLTQHILFWLAVIIYFTIGYGAPGRYAETFARVLLFLPGHIFLTYVFFYYLISFFLLKKKYGLFTLLGVVTYFSSLLYAYVINFHVLTLLHLQSIWVGSPLIGQTTMLGAALSIKFLKQYYKEKQNAMELGRQKNRAELDLLKSQVHPHFLFNTLNNLYSHVLEHSPKAPDILLKLSELLRFLIYESSSAFIPLEQEISLIRKYIELEQLRYGDRLDVSFSVEGDFQNRFITPLLLLPLIENAIKHGVSNQIDQCWISLTMYTEGDKFHFKLVNSKDHEPVLASRTHNGLGLYNVRKRLELAYADQHLLKIDAEEDMFIIILELILPQVNSIATQDETHIRFLNPDTDGKNKVLAGGR
jgi:sensor histidine kinase YesM